MLSGHIAERAGERAGPGRPRAFDLDEAVAAAIEVFRAHGYHGASLTDLTDGTGLARGSLYKAFHDKRSLFLAALEQYGTASLGRISQTLVQPGLARAAIRETLMGYARRAAAAQGQRSCLVTVAALEMMPADQQVSAIVNRLFRQIQDLFAACIIRGQASGELRRDLDERVVARHLLCIVQGLRILGKTAPSEADLAELVDLTLRVLD